MTIGNRKFRRAHKGNGGKGVAAPVHTADDLQMLLDAANAGGVTTAVAIRCPHSRGTPGLVMNLPTYLAHRFEGCPIAKVSTDLDDLLEEESRIIQPGDAEFKL